MIIKKYLTKVSKITSPLKDIYKITFQTQDKDFKFKPGQFLHLTLDDYNQSLPWPESRCFSIQSTPDNKREITLTFSVVGNYTKRMASELSLDKSIWLKLPYGELFAQKHNKSKTVLIAGGTGVTPYLSLINSKEFSEYQNPILYLGIKDKSYNLYSDDLSIGCEINSTFNIKVIEENISGKLSANKILNDCGKDCDYFVSGPPNMIKSFRTYFLENGISINQIFTDEWE